MPKGRGTASQLHVDGAYVEFQMAVLRALPRDIDPDVADGWRENGEALARVLYEILVPSEQKQLDLLKLAATVPVRSRGKSGTAAHFVREVLMPSERK